MTIEHVTQLRDIYLLISEATINKIMTEVTHNFKCTTSEASQKTLF